jgi:hypothetical protein
VKRELFKNIKALPYTSAAAIDRLGFSSAVLAVKIDTITGDPTAAKLAVAVTHADTVDGDYDDVTDEYIFPDGADEFAVDVEKGLEANIPIDLAGCKRFVKITCTVTFTDGAAPSSTNAYAIVLGDPTAAPVEV